MATTRPSRKSISTRIKRSRPSEAKVAILKATRKKKQQQQDSRQAEIDKYNRELDEAEDFDLLIQTVTPERCFV